MPERTRYAMVHDALCRQWWTVKDLAAYLNADPHVIRFWINTISRSQVIFCRRERDRHYQPKAYRILRQAWQVRPIRRLRVVKL